MTLPRRAPRRVVLGLLLTAPPGLLLSGCGGADPASVAAERSAAPPRLLATASAAKSLESAASDSPWRASRVAYDFPVESEGVFRLPMLADASRVIPAARAEPRSEAGPFFPEHRVPPHLDRHPPADQSPRPAPPAAREPAEPPELTAEEIAKVRPLPTPNAAPPRVKPAASPTPRNDAAVGFAMRAVAREAADRVRSGFDLADRGALFSARSEFIAALRIVSQALDARSGGRAHGRALAAGLRALAESDDFIPRGASVEGELNVAALLAGHQTPVLKDAPPRTLTPLIARRAYYTYAQEQLARSMGRERAGSMALFALAKLHTALEKRNATEYPAAGPKAMALHQAALLVDAGNYMAANELGVLLAKYGQYPQARAALIHSLNQTPLPAAWHNLAVVHHHLGEDELAARAEQEARLLARRTDGREILGQQTGVVWTDPAAFARIPPAGAAPTPR
jgi:hypothetical protein